MTYPFVTPDVWALVELYLLPIDHPIKCKVDRLFQKKRVTQSLGLFEQAGFRAAEMRKPTHIVVGKHPDFNGYLFKVFEKNLKAFKKKMTSQSLLNNC